MTPKLIAIAGPLNNSVFTIEEALSIGRDPSNHVCLRATAVSRQHCLIRRDGERFNLLDHQSHNGTFVNDLPISEHVLAHGDRIAIGGSVFVFSSNEATAEPVSRSVSFTHPDERLSTITTLDRDPVRVDAGTAKGDLLRQARTLERIIQINTVLTAILEPEPLKRELLARLLDLTSADTAAVLLFDETDDTPSSILGLERGGAPVRTMTVSRTLVRRVLQEKIGILIENVAADNASGSHLTLHSAGCRSALAVPLRSRDRLSGILYLDTRRLDARLNQNDLELTMAVAAVAGFALDNALHFDRLRQHTELLRKQLDRDLNIVGTTPAMQAVYGLITKVAASSATVLLLGESGTGKELAARAIHHKSPRADKPFVALNCASFAENLLESELFGHERGAFTGAITSKRGQLELADGGTLFLDEVGDLPLSVQVKLLRVLQEREFIRVGGSHPIRVNVRIVAATNRDLKAAVEAGTFRNDLWFRLNVVAITLPPLRERPEDIGLLANYFIAKFSRNCGRVVTGLSGAAKNALLRYSWPGNVRELENAIERAIVLGEHELIHSHDLPETVWEARATPRSDEPTSYEGALRELKQKLIVDAVAAANGNYAEAARRLGVHVTYLHRLIRSFNLKPALEKLRT